MNFIDIQVYEAYLYVVYVIFLLFRKKFIFESIVSNTGLRCIPLEILQFV